MNRVKQTNILLIMIVLFWFAMYVYIPYQTPYLLMGGAAASMVGAVIGGYGLTQFILRLPVGVIADRKPRHKLIIVAGTILAAVASLIRLAVPGATGFLVANLLSGCAAATWLSYVVVYPGHFEKEGQQKAMGQVFAANNGGILVGFIAASLLYEPLGMQALCALSIIAGVLAAVLGVLFLRMPKVEKKPPKVKELLSVLKDKRLILFAVFALVQQGIVMSTSISFTTQVAKELSNTSLEVGICSVVYIAVGIASALLVGQKNIERLGPKFFVPAIFLCLFLYCLLVPNVTSIYALYFAQVLAGMSQGILMTYCTSEGMAHVPPEKKSTAMGFFQAVYAIGMTLMPILAGAISGTFSMDTAFYALSVFPAAAFICAVLYYARKKRLSKTA